MSKLAQTLLTGVTGFIGSSLAARLLHDGRRVVALSRRDPKGNKTRAMVLKAAVTLGLPVDEETCRRNLTTIETSIEDAAQRLRREDLAEVDRVWHLAANLAYSHSYLTRSLQVNFQATTDFYRAVSELAPQCRRFYHVSTAYTFGFPRPDETIPEALHDCPRQPNAYQLSKWCAENGLQAASLRSRLPVSVVRPSIVIGSSHNGAYHGDAFGLYMFFSAVHPLLDMPGFHDLRLPRSINGYINLIPIDVLIDNLLDMESCDDGRLPPFDVVHCTGQAVPARVVAEAGAKVTGLNVSFEGPRSALDRIFASRVEENRIFAEHRFHFEEKRLPELLGKRFRQTRIDEEAMVKIIDVYLRRLSVERGHVAIPTLLRPVLPWFTRSRSQLGPAMALWLSRSYRKRARAALVAG